MMKTLVGTVVSNKMQKAVIVEIERRFVHPLYKKSTRRSSRLKARSDKALTVGDVVAIEETKPMSKQIHYKVKNVITKVV